jgi:hypothetical protein
VPQAKVAEDPGGERIHGIAYLLPENVTALGVTVSLYLATLGAIRDGYLHSDGFALQKVTWGQSEGPYDTRAWLDLIAGPLHNLGYEAAAT